MKKTNYAKYFLVVFVVVLAAGAWRLIKNWDEYTTPPCVYNPQAKEVAREFTKDTGELKFLSNEDKDKIFKAIDSAKDPKELDSKLFFALSEVLDSKGESGMLLAPEILSDNPGSISITSNGCKSDLLEGVGLTPIKKEDMQSLKAFAKIFVEETSRYPLSWRDKAVPPFVVFVKALRVNGEIVGGVEQGAVIFNINDIKYPDESRRVVHHELMHWLDHYYGTGTDEAWPGNNSVYKNEYDLTSEDNHILHPEDGFITGYAKTNAMEDRAEVYAYLFTPDGNSYLNSLVRSDKLLDSKVKYIKKFISDRVGKMDDKYFESYVSAK